MDRNKDNAASPASDRIVDRKIESKALPSGFSSNLGRKAPTGDKAGPGKSVKAIVDWLEKTSTPAAENPELRTQEDCDKAESDDRLSLLSKTTKTTESDLLQATKPEITTASPLLFSKTPPTQPEEYSLTLLGYKSYFNNRPLARCLDDEEAEFTTPTANPTPTAASASSFYSIRKVDSIKTGLPGMRDGAGPRVPAPLVRSFLESQSLPEGSTKDCVDPVVESCSGAGIAEVSTVAETQVVSRDPTEARAF